VKDAWSGAQQREHPGRSTPVVTSPACGEAVVVNGAALSIAKYRGQLYVFDQNCPHQGWVDLFFAPPQDLPIPSQSPPNYIQCWMLRRLTLFFPLFPGGNLALGDIEDLGIREPLISCPNHHWRYSLVTGQCHLPAHGPTLKVYRHRVNPEGKIFVGFEQFSPSFFTGDEF